MNLAIDSKPLRPSILQTQDYSGLQLYGLMVQSLSQEIVEWEVSSDGLSYSLLLKSSDSPALYVNGIRSLLNSTPIYRKTLFRKLRAIEEIHSGIRVSLVSRQNGFEKNFFLPNWVPVSGSNVVSLYRLDQVNSNQWDLFSDLGKREHSVFLVHSPEENYNLSLQGKLDYSADTATPLGMDLGEVSSYDTGLWACLWFGEKLQNNEKSVRLRESLKNFRFENGKSLFERQLTQIDPPCDQSKPFHRASSFHLSIGYDSFSPNYEMAALIKTHLTQQGWTVSLKSDSYYEPNYDCDAKILILRPIVGSCFHFLYSLLPLCKTRKSFEFIKGKILLFESHEDQQACRIQELEENCNAFHFLTKIPSLSFTRQRDINPMVQKLLIQENFVQ